MSIMSWIIFATVMERPLFYALLVIVVQELFSIEVKRLVGIMQVANHLNGNLFVDVKLVYYRKRLFIILTFLPLWFILLHHVEKEFLTCSLQIKLGLFLLSLICKNCLGIKLKIFLLL